MPTTMPRDFFDSTPEQQNVVLVEVATLRKAEQMIERSDPSVTDYIFEEPAKCPRCRHDILEKTLVEPI